MRSFFNRSYFNAFDCFGALHSVVTRAMINICPHRVRSRTLVTFERFCLSIADMKCYLIAHTSITVFSGISDVDSCIFCVVSIGVRLNFLVISAGMTKMLLVIFESVSVGEVFIPISRMSGVSALSLFERSSSWLTIFMYSLMRYLGFIPCISSRADEGTFMRSILCVPSGTVSSVGDFSDGCW